MIFQILNENCKKVLNCHNLDVMNVTDKLKIIANAEEPGDGKVGYQLNLEDEK